MTLSRFINNMTSPLLLTSAVLLPASFSPVRGGLTHSDGLVAHFNVVVSSHNQLTLLQHGEEKNGNSGTES